jgi:PAS domain S-box-containing protein
MGVSISLLAEYSRRNRLKSAAYDKEQALREGRDALRESEERFRVLTQNLVSAVALIDANGEFSIVNKSFLRMFDLDENADILNINSRDWGQWQVFDENGRLLDADEHPVRQAVLSHTAVKDKLVAMQSPAGTGLKWLLVSAEPIWDGQGDLQYVICTYHNITDRKRAEEALLASERRERERAAELATVLDAVPVPVVIVHDPDSHHMTGNRASDELLRHPRGAEVSLSASPETKPRHFRPFKDGRELRLDELPAQRAARGEHVQDFEFNLVFDDGTVRDLLAYGTPLRDEQGQPRGAVHVLVDITQRKQAEEALRVSEERLRQAADLVSLLPYTWELPLGVLHWSTELKALWGLPPDAVIDHEVFLAGVHPEDRAYVEDRVALSLEPAGKGLYEAEYRVIGADGVQRWIAARGRTTFVDGNPIIHLGVALDITERKQAEAHLKADIAALSQMHALSGRSLGTRGLQPLLQEVMNAAVAIMGTERGTLQLLEGDSLRIVAHHGHQQPFLDFFASAEDRASVCGEAMLRGERVVVQDVENSPLFAGTPSLPVLKAAGVRAVQSTPLVSRAGVLLGILTTQWGVQHCPDEHDLWRLDLLARQAADLIEHAKAEEALRVNEERLRLAQLSAKIGVWDWNLKTGALVWSPELEAIWGLPPGTVTSYRDFSERVHPDDLAMTEAKSDSAVRNHESFDLEFRIIRPSGEVRWILAKGGALYDDHGEPTRIFGSNIDITERKQTEQALLRSEKLAAVGRMAASIAHEINNPLSAVMNTIYLAQCADDLLAVRRYLGTAEDELKRISHITRQTLGFYREHSTPAIVSINDIMDSAVDLLQGKIKLKRAKVEKRYDGDIRASVISGELRQVFSNLLANSLDAVGEEGTIKLRVSKSTYVNSGEPRIRVTVGDDGKGIDRATLPRIFEPLFTTKEATGSGLGLWVSKQIIDKHKGSIHLRSRTDGERRGTVFSILLPVLGTAAAKSTTASSS